MARLPKKKLVKKNNMKSSKKKKKRPKIKEPEGMDPTEEDILMANAYGGIPKGAAKKKSVKHYGGASSRSRGSANGKRYKVIPTKQDNLFRLGNSISGMGDPNGTPDPDRKVLHPAAG